MTRIFNLSLIITIILMPTQSLQLDRKTTNESITGKTSSNANTTDVPVHNCTYQNLQYCHRYIKNIFVLYTGIGGWVMFGIIVAGILLQIHLLVTARNTQGLITLKRTELKYAMAQTRRKKKNSFGKT